jgi:3-dehydroquinate synthase
MTEVLVEIHGAPYTDHIGPVALDLVGRPVPPSAAGQRAAAIADETTEKLFGQRVVAALEQAGWRAHPTSVPSGEQSKTLDTAGRLRERLSQAGIDRASTVCALGGGLVGDLAGSVAATCMKGVPFVPLPTTLLPQTDSSVGGKVGVNLPRGKNLTGAFHQPFAAVADPETLRSLDRRQVSAGMAEVVKHAAIADSALFAELEWHAEELLALGHPPDGHRSHELPDQGLHRDTGPGGAHGGPFRTEPRTHGRSRHQAGRDRMAAPARRGCGYRDGD